MKLGIVISNYNSVEFIDDFFKGWIAYIFTHPENQIGFSIIDTKFTDNNDNNSLNYSNDGSIEKLREYQKSIIDYLTISDKQLTEWDARNLALKPLLEKDCDYILSTAFDEVFKSEDIEKIINYIQKDPFILTYRINYKNYVGTRITYIKGFNPKRIWKANDKNYKILGFHYDDDMKFIHYEEKIDEQLPIKTIPNLEIDHYCWLDGERSRKKIEYQNSRAGWQCSYKYENGKVLIDEDWHRKRGLEIPVIYEN